LVHGPDEAKEGILVVAHGIDGMSPGAASLIVTVTFISGFLSGRGQEKSSSSQLEDTEDGDGSAESAGGGGQEGDGESAIIGHSGQGSKTLDKGQKAEEEKSHESLAVHC